MKNIAIIMGGYSSEYKISLISGILCTTIWIKQNTGILRPYTERKVGLRGRAETEYPIDKMIFQ
jgi:D-alanine-D-alanine ligase